MTLSLALFEHSTRKPTLANQEIPSEENGKRTGNEMRIYLIVKLRLKQM